jgi:hypothetical protein
MRPGRRRLTTATRCRPSVGLVAAEKEKHLPHGEPQCTPFLPLRSATPEEAVGISSKRVSRPPSGNPPVAGSARGGSERPGEPVVGVVGVPANLGLDVPERAVHGDGLARASIRGDATEARGSPTGPGDASDELAVRSSSGSNSGQQFEQLELPSVQRFSRGSQRRMPTLAATLAQAIGVFPVRGVMVGGESVRPMWTDARLPVRSRCAVVKKTRSVRPGAGSRGRPTGAGAGARRWAGGSPGPPAPGARR